MTSDRELSAFRRLIISRSRTVLLLRDGARPTSGLRCGGLPRVSESPCGLA